MRIDCPRCGNRCSREFSYKGSAEQHRPRELNRDQYVEYVYMRDNLAGNIEEYWHHTQGCRNWLIVTRDTLNHTIHGVRLAHPHTTQTGAQDAS